jgi:hypothetical protein
MILAILLISCVASFIVYHIYFLETDECESNPCLNNGTCTDLVYDYNCTCELFNLVEQELLTIPEHLSSHPVLVGFVLLDP